MVNQDLLAIFMMLTALAVLIQTAIAAGLYYMTAKVSRQADRAMTHTRQLLTPLETVADSVRTASARIAEFTATVRWRGNGGPAGGGG